MHIFTKKNAEKFGGIRKMLYLCTRNSEMMLTAKKYFVMRSKRGVAQPGSAPVLGTGGRRFESCRPDLSNHSESKLL